MRCDLANFFARDATNKMEVQLPRSRFQQRTRNYFINVVAASLCRGVPALLLPAARRHSAVATTPHAYKMASSYLLESNANGCRRRVAPLSRFAAAPEHRVMASILSQRKPAGSQTD